MSEKTTVAFRVDESVKQEWEDAAENPEYDSLSHLIRLAVQKEITETETAETDTQADVEANSEILGSLNRLEKSIDEIQDEMEAVGRENHAEEMYELEQVLLEVLPTASKEIDPITEVEPDRLEAGATTPRDVAGRIGADTSDVADTLERLAENTGQVESVTNPESGDTYYWRVE